ncbi:hypothetical protein Tcan_00673, partial [Toxocara canis]
MENSIFSKISDSKRIPRAKQAHSTETDSHMLWEVQHKYIRVNHIHQLLLNSPEHSTCVAISRILHTDQRYNIIATQRRPHKRLTHGSKNETTATTDAYIYDISFTHLSLLILL